MSLLTISQDDTKGGKGAALPARTYRFTVEEAKIEEIGGGTSLTGRLGNLRTKEGAGEFEHNGSTYHIGNRKVFFRHWVDHTNAKAAEVGQSFIKRLALSTGLVPVPSNGEKVELDFESWPAFAEAIVGKDGLVLTKQRHRKGADGEDLVEADIATYLLP